MKGLKLNEKFYRQIVAPILEVHFPNLSYSAALIGWGSEVLGYDDGLSTDHNWGLRFQLFISNQDDTHLFVAINNLLNEKLPTRFQDYPVNMEIAVNEDQIDRQRAAVARHNIEISTLENYLQRYLGCHPLTDMNTADWLSLSEHKLLSVIKGAVFHDGLGTLTMIRKKLSYYPKLPWLHRLLRQWQQILDIQAFPGRCGYTGDELGAKVLAAQQVRHLMQLCFLLEKQYAPYAKWLGTAFAELPCATELQPVLENILRSEDWKKRDAYLAEAYRQVIRLFNRWHLIPPVSDEVGLYFGRPFLCIQDDSMIGGLQRLIEELGGSEE